MSPPLGVLVGVTQGLALALGVGLLTYVGLVVVPYLRHRPAASGDPREFGWHVLVPCRDEEAVIGGTVEHVRRTFPPAHVWVIDDASADETATVIGGMAARDGGVHLVRRYLPDARTGRADALDAGYREVVAWLASYGALGDAERTIVCVVDPGSRLAPEAPAVCSGPALFGDPAVGAVQVGVRMSTRDGRSAGPRHGRIANLLVRMQDLDRTAIAAFRLSRRRTGSVNMGGSGQFTRLSALAGIDDDASGRPWRGSPPEVELGVRLLTAGYRTAFTPDAHVDQAGLPTLRRLLTQRTRRMEESLRHLRRVWTSEHVTTLGAVVVLVQPWLQLLGTLVYPVPWILLAHRTATEPDAVRAYFSDGSGWLLFGTYGALGLAPFLLWGPVHRRRCEPGAGWLHALGWGLAYAAYRWTMSVTSWRAALRIVRRRLRVGWPATRRTLGADTQRIVT